MHETRQMRDIMASQLGERMKSDDGLFLLDADLARANGTLELYSRHPERTADVGIAEANMACIAAGLASYGFRPFIFTFTAFATRRICDQLAISIAYAGMDVKIVGTDPGLSAELNGGTHMSVEDVGVVRSIPSMVIFEPVDGDQLAKAMPQIFEYRGPLYIRLFRKVPPATYFAGDDYRFDLFSADVLRPGTDVSIFATGIEVHEAMQAADILSGEGVSAEVVNVHTIKPIDAEAILASVEKTGCAVSCENHNVVGGLGSAVAETLAGALPVPLERIGIPDRFGEVGKRPDLVKAMGMDAASVTAAARRAMERKVG
jgi:transketolase